MKQAFFGGSGFVFGALAQVVVGRRFGPSGLAVFTLGTVLVALAGHLLPLGTASALAVRVKLRRDRVASGYFRAAEAVTVCSGVVGLVVFGWPLSALWERFGFDTAQSLLILLAGLLRSLLLVVVAFRESQLRITAAGVPGAAVFVAQLVIAAAVPADMTATDLTVAALLGSAVLGLLVAVATSDRSHGAPATAAPALGEAMRDLLRLGWPLAVVGLAAFATVWLDRPILGLVLTPRELGLYSALILAPRTIRYLPQFFTNMLLSVYGDASDDVRRFREYASLDLAATTIFFSASGILMAALLPYLVPLVFGARFGSDDLQTFSTAIGWTVVVSPWLVQTTNWLNSLGRTRTNMYLSLLEVTLVASTIPAFFYLAGLPGAFWAQALSASVMASIRALLVARWVAPTLPREWLPVGAASLAIVLATILLGTWALALAPAAAVAAMRSPVGRVPARVAAILRARSV